MSMQTPSNQYSDYLSDLPTILRWIDSIFVAHYQLYLEGMSIPSLEVERARREVAQLRAVLTGQVPSESSLRIIHLLIASGVLRWRAPAQAEALDIPPTLVHSLICSALWPLVITPNLPADWPLAVEQIASPAVADLIVRLRRRRTGETSAALAMRFARELQDMSLAKGLSTLLDDLRNPVEGGAALTAIAIIRDHNAPPTHHNARDLLKWILIAGAGGIIGNRADAIVVSTFNWIEEHIPTSSDNELDIRIVPPSVVKRTSVVQPASSYDGKNPSNNPQNDAVNFPTSTQQHLSDSSGKQIHPTSLLHGTQIAQSGLLDSSVTENHLQDSQEESSGFLDELVEFVNDSCLGRAAALFLLLLATALLVGLSLVTL